MSLLVCCVYIFGFPPVLPGDNGKPEYVWLDAVCDGDFTIISGWNQPLRNLAVNGSPLSINGQRFERGIGTHAPSYWGLDLAGRATRFQAAVGVDDRSGGSTVGDVEFRVYGDAKLLWKSGTMRAGDAAKTIDVDLTGIQHLHLYVGTADGDQASDHANWADARVLTKGKTVKAIDFDAPCIVTPKPGAKPRINSPAIFGVRPGSYFNYRIAVSGDKSDLSFKEKGLPRGLKLDKDTGIISGVIKDRTKRSYMVELKVLSRAFGVDQKMLEIRVGEDFQLTPVMGWNSWYNYSTAITEENVRAQARAMVDSGLADHGFTFINIDDGWQGARDSANKNALQGNERFGKGHETGTGDGDLGGVVDFIHKLGLKAGIYSSPWVGTFAGFRGSSTDNPDGTNDNELRWPADDMDHRTQVFGKSGAVWGTGAKAKDYVGHWQFDKDALQFARWRLDLVKMDWHLNRNDRRTDSDTVCRRIRENLDSTGRDIVLSLSNNANSGYQFTRTYAPKYANCWRATGDIYDEWGDIIKATSIVGIGFNQDHWASSVSSGHFMDADMLQIGVLGVPNNPAADFKPTRLKPNEQYSHFSLWCLLSSPLILTNDLTKMDKFTLRLLTNDEVIAINQDSLGMQATRYRSDGKFLVMAKPLADGGRAVGIFNLGEQACPYELPLGDLELDPCKKVLIRDLWRQRDLGEFQRKFETIVEPHGVVLIKVNTK